MLYTLWCLIGMIAWASGSESCTESLTDQYKCWNANSILRNDRPDVCIQSAQRCGEEQRCHCPWCDDQWNCPSFEECEANGGFVCSHSLSAETQQAWACIPREWACDGIWDCPSGEDESREFCDVSYCEGNRNLTYWYQCSDNGRCVEILTLGDGENDCVNGEDEDPDVLSGILLTTSAEPVEMVGQTTTEEVEPEPEGGSGTTTTTQASTSASTSVSTSTSASASTSTTQIVSTTTKTPLSASYGIDLMVNVWGVGFEVCTGPQARFEILEGVFASVFALSNAQVSSSCQLDMVLSPNHRRLWDSSSFPFSSSSSSSSSSSFPFSSSRFSSASSSSSSSDSGDREKDNVAAHGLKIQKVLINLRFDKKTLYMRTLQRMLRESDSSSSDSEELDINIRGLNNEIGVNLSNALRKLVRVEILRISGNA